MTAPVAMSRAVPRVVVGAALDLARAHRQQRLGAVERLDLRLLVHAEHQRVLGWAHVEPDDVAHLLDEERVRRELEGLAPMRLQAEGAPDTVDRRRRVADCLRHRAERPVGRSRGYRLEGQADCLSNLVIADLARRAGSWLVEKSIDAARGEAATPFRDRVGVCPYLGADRLVLQPSRRSQHDPRPPGHRLSRAVRACQRFQLTLLRRRQLDRHRGLAHRQPLRTIKIVGTSRSGH